MMAISPYREWKIEWALVGLYGFIDECIKYKIVRTVRREGNYNGLSVAGMMVDVRKALNA